MGENSPARRTASNQGDRESLSRQPGKEPTAYLSERDEQSQRTQNDATWTRRPSWPRSAAAANRPAPAVPAQQAQRYRAELVQLRRAGASYPDLATWLRTRHRLRVSHTTVMRYLRGLPEMADDRRRVPPAMPSFRSPRGQPHTRSGAPWPWARPATGPATMAASTASAPPGSTNRP